MQCVHVCRCCSSHCNHVQMVRVGSAQTHHEWLVMPLRAQPCQVGLCGAFHQAPSVDVEGVFGVKVLDAIAHVAQVGHTAHVSSLSDGLCGDSEHFRRRLRVVHQRP